MENSLEIFLAKTEAWDLSKVEARLEGNESWPKGVVDEIKPFYLRFMALASIRRGEILIPSPLIDTFWGYHILDTPSYMKDCEQAFGQYIHHIPSDLLNLAPRDLEQYRLTRERTLALYVNTYGKLGPIGESIWNQTDFHKIDFELVDINGISNNPRPKRQWVI